ncbi:SAC3 domain-containing protein 1 [Eumeta japonica]|uniref:SAC3 domain-containing protein 1 n=1 Tax=Eumeta variegata TaxID=151549 RepID=A0A4C2A2Y1_EUMVA|nr:SAC3 domain-containing protein 1 [Eumeta japonica]
MDDVKRERENLVHILEVWNTADHKNVLVKRYGRSAANSNMAVPQLLRPFDVLKQSVHYLLLEITKRCDVTIPTLYDFINDRLRSVRQDAIIQQLPAAQCMLLLEPMIRFYVLYSYMPSIETMSDRLALQSTMRWKDTSADLASTLQGRYLGRSADLKAKNKTNLFYTHLLPIWLTRHSVAFYHCVATSAISACRHRERRAERRRVACPGLENKANYRLNDTQHAVLLVDSQLERCGNTHDHRGAPDPHFVYATGGGGVACWYDTSFFKVVSLSGYPVKDFDPVLNKQYLLECLKWFLNCWDEIQCKEETVQNVTESLLSMHLGHGDELICDNVLVEALYILCNLNDVHPVYRYLTLPKKIQRCRPLQTAFNIAIACLHGNFVRVFRLANALCPLTRRAFFMHVPRLQRRAVQVLSAALSGGRGRGVPLPSAAVGRLLGFSDAAAAARACHHYGLALESDADRIVFDKRLFKHEAHEGETQKNISSSVAVVLRPPHKARAVRKKSDHLKTLSFSSHTARNPRCGGYAAHRGAVVLEATVAAKSEHITQKGEFLSFPSLDLQLCEVSRIGERDNFDQEPAHTPSL